jgi:Tfp pilus assembly protein PilN
MTMTTQTPMPTPGPAQAPGPAQTALMPLDPTVSPQQSLRILPIRANLLPDEITAGRNARRTRTLLAAVLVLTIAVLAGWCMYAVRDRNAAADELASVTKQVDDTSREMKADKYTKVTKTIQERDTITDQLKAAMANDLPWYTLMDQLRTTGIASVKITSISGALDKVAAGGTTTAATVSKKAGAVTVSGTAKDKKTIAAYLKALADAKLVTNVYLTAGNEQDKNVWTFTLNADIPKSALCGRFTTPCKSGGK